MKEDKRSALEIQIDQKLAAEARVLSEAASIIVFLLGVLVLIGWQFDFTVLKNVSPDFVAMKPNTALGLIFLGASLWFLQEKRLKSWFRYLGWGSAIMAALIGVMTIVEYFFGLNLGIDNLFFTETSRALFTVYPGRMAWNTAFVFIFFGISLIYLDIKTKCGTCLGSLAAMLGGGVALLVVIGYVYDVSEFYFAKEFYTPMALHTAMSFLLICLGILSARPENKLIRIFVSGGSAGITARRLLPWAFILPLGIGWLEEFGHHYGLYSEDFGKSLSSTLSIIVLAGLIWLNAVATGRREVELDRAQGKIKEEQVFSKAVIDGLPGTFALMSKEGRLVRWNKNLETISGYSGAELLDLTEKKGEALFFKKEDLDLVQKSIEKSFKYGSDQIEADSFVGRGKSAVPYLFISVRVEINKEPYLIVWGIDISRLKQAEENMRKEKEIAEFLAKDLEKFKLAVDGASDHIIITDPKGIILFANKAVSVITGYTQAEVIGRNPGEIWGGHMPKEFYSNMWRVIKSEKNVFVGEITNRKKNGAEYIAELHVAPILDKNGQVQFFVGIERDVTKERALDKLKSEFVTIASHQLRTPLTAVKWHLELLLASKLSAKERSGLRQVFDSNQRMIRLVGDLLDVSRIEEGKKFAIVFKKTDIMPIVKSVVNEQVLAARENKISVKLDSSFPKKLELLVDDEKIRQALQNLIDNAVKYSFPKGKVLVGYQSAADSAIFYVKDSGVGIPRDQQDRIFQKFFRAENVSRLKDQGTGLGLYITKAIVEGHGGKIWFESKEGEGTTFYFSLPLNK